MAALPRHIACGPLLLPDLFTFVGQHDYTVAEMDAFARYVAVHPFDREGGLLAYLQAFAARQST